MKVREIRILFQQALSSMYEEEELEEILFLAMESVKGFSKTDSAMQADVDLSEKETQEFEKIIRELKTHKPIQYITGYSWFYGMKLLVNENVLIPRPETEELVTLIVEQNKSVNSKLKILDIGTGSGCIAIALKKKFPEAEVTALDISADALAVAKANAKAQHVHIHFIQQDMLQPQTLKLEPGTEFDIIVSNPPYVLHSDKPTLHERVIQYEPHLALFADEKDDLVYYLSIADYAFQFLTKGGQLFLEIHHLKGREVKQLLNNSGFIDIEVKKDMSGKDRIVKAGKKRL
jgi:release factor glutamine methyltransferase